MPPRFTTRSDWADLPQPVVRSLERALGDRIVGFEAVHGGMSPGPAARLSLDGGRQVFAKAVAEQQNPKAHQLYACEIDVLRALPREIPHAPLVANVERDGWTVIATEAADGGVAGPPWRSQDVAAVAAALDSVASQSDLPGLPPAVERLPALDGWEHLATTSRDVLDDWEVRHLDTLLAMTNGWRTWTAGRHLVHLDVRCDNVVRHRDDVWLVDWAHAATGARWIDQACLAVDVVASGHVGGERVAVSTARGILTGLPYEATRLVVAMAGMFRRNALRERVPAVPELREWQASRARSLRSLVERLVSRPADR
jgi:hypothetical protein